MNQNSFKSKLVYEVAQGFNAYGSLKLTFSIEDIISDYGVYYYKNIGFSDQAIFLISKTSVHNTEPKNEHDEDRHRLAIDLYHSYSCKLEISLFDAKIQELLNYFTFNYSFENQTFETSIKDYIDEGITEYLVMVENLGNGEKQKYLIKK